MKDVRCDSGILFGMLDDNTLVLETKCKSNRCGAGPGVVVIHRFDCKTGELLGTQRFKDPAAMSRRETRKEVNHGR